MLTAQQVFDLVDAIDPRCRALVLLAVFGSLRWGELAALRLCDIDLSTRTVRIVRQLAELRGGGFGFAPPKSAAGKRIIVIPAALEPAVRQHVGALGEPDGDSLVFTSPGGTQMRPDAG